MVERELLDGADLITGVTPPRDATISASQVSRSITAEAASLASTRKSETAAAVIGP